MRLSAGASFMRASLQPDHAHSHWDGRAIHVIVLSNDLPAPGALRTMRVSGNPELSR